MLIYINDAGVRVEKRNIQSATEKLNTFHKQVEKLLGKLTIKELERLPEQGDDVIMDNLRKRYSFENATDEFNLNALGIDPSLTIESFKKGVREWRKYNFNYTDGGYTIDDEQKHLEKHYTYAKTEEEKKLVILYENFANTYNEIAETGMNLRISSFLEVVPSVFKSARTNLNIQSKYVTIDNARLASHLNMINAYKSAPPRETSAEIFEKLNIQPLNNRYNNG